VSGADTAAAALRLAREGGPAARWLELLPADLGTAYAVQDATLASWGAAAGWKVGAKNLQDEPQAAPLPAVGLLPSGARLFGPAWRLRGVELELALRVAKDLPASGEALSGEALVRAFDAVLPVIEVVESRLDDWFGAAPLARLADLQSHGALVLGDPLPMPESAPDLRLLDATLDFDGVNVAQTHGGNPAADVWRMLSWLQVHCAARGQPWRRGQIITTGSCTGMLFAPLGTRVEGRLAGIGPVSLRF
jgi:2-keto-4-pentenoate hydratase